MEASTERVELWLPHSMAHPETVQQHQSGRCSLPALFNEERRMHTACWHA